MESETQQIALGLRQGDVVVLEALVERYQSRLVRYLIYLLGSRDGEYVDDRHWAIACDDREHGMSGQLFG